MLAGADLRGQGLRRAGGNPQTPAMKRALTDHVWSMEGRVDFPPFKQVGHQALRGPVDNIDPGGDVGS